MYIFLRGGLILNLCATVIMFFCGCLQSDFLMQTNSSLGPDTTSNLELSAPIDRWDEAIPLGNGLTGGLLWGNGSHIKLSLDRADLWDLRTPETLLRDDWNLETLKKLVAEKNQDKIVELFDVPYSNVPYPTKLPAGRLELTLDESQQAKSFHLDLRNALARVDVGVGGFEVFFSADESVTIIRIVGPLPKWRIVAPPAVVNQLSYAPAQTGSEGTCQWFLQKCALGMEFAVVVQAKRIGAATEIAISITSTRDGVEPLALGKKRVQNALDNGFDNMFKPHVRWWREFWSQSSVKVPDKEVQQHYDLVQYFYGAASRKGAPPIHLQGVWTTDNGNLPPWKGDYHNDLNTELTYWAYLTSGRFDEGESFLDFMWELRPAFRFFAKKFYDKPGMAIPGVMTHDGKPMGGWSMYACMPTHGAWIAEAFYRHWLYTNNRDFLIERAWPFCEEIAVCLEALMTSDENGMLKLPLSSSPEYHHNRIEAWMTPNTNYDQALMRSLFEALLVMAEEIGEDKATDAVHWKSVLSRMEALAVEGEDGSLMLSPDEPISHSTFHHSHLMAIHPLGTLNIESSDRDRRIINASLKKLEDLGPGSWSGYCWSWMSCIYARCGQAEKALRHLKVFLEAFIVRNGFHQNGDMKDAGYSTAYGSVYRYFTLEGNFAASQAVHEMLLQSWGGTVRIFPAVSDKWADVSFDNFRAEGGFKVSAKRRNGRCVSVRIEAEHNGILQLRDPFNCSLPHWNRKGITRDGNNYQCRLKSGQTLEGHID